MPQQVERDPFRDLSAYAAIRAKTLTVRSKLAVYPFRLSGPSFAPKDLRSSLLDGFRISCKWRSHGKGPGVAVTAGFTESILVGLAARVLPVCLRSLRI